jgi:valyl-tRNA synthetase
MPSELAKVYDPKAVEAEISRRWEQAGAFRADTAKEGPKYCIVMPPPNVTAALHLGHALNNTLQDVLIRYRRMNQFNTLWMPGTDHAGIATQTVVEKRILAEEGKRRTDFSREDFVARIQAWKDEYEARIIQQLKAMGCSCDWPRTRFTMDETCAAAVRAAFFKLFCDGLIYRGKRLVNWDPATQTVLADDEVEHEEVAGHFWYLRYPLTVAVDLGDGQRVTHVTVATTRPETMLGDTAVAMNPADPRAKRLVGKKVRLPIVGREIPIIADEHVVLSAPDSQDEKARFSTGFLKVTPAHDPDDWAIGQRHGLAVINVMAPDGTISDRHGWTDWGQIKNPDVENLIGLDRFEAREAVVEFFRKENLLEEVRPYTHQVGHSYRSGVPIEPYLSDQWYIAVKKPIPGRETSTSSRELVDEQGLLRGTDVPATSLAGLALAPLLDGRLKFIPDRYARTYQSWLENLRDWPISRQLWWGHQIPVWSLMYSPAYWGGDQELKKRRATAINQFFTVCGIADEIVIRSSEQLVEGIFPDYVCALSPKAEKALDLIGRILAHKSGTGRNTVRQNVADNAELEAEFGEDALQSIVRLREFVRTVRRDEDVLDTWFSSALWPFSTMGWPGQTPELKRYYPGDVLVTAREIITLWVSRMVMMGQYCLGDIPFSEVFIHAMIQDGQGRKMSKSLGNGIDPLEVIDSHGADAMRFTLVSMTTQTQDVRMPVETLKLPDGREANTSPKFDIGRNFCNKLWNASRFVMMNLHGQPPWSDVHPGDDLADTWILSRLNATIRDVTEAIDGFRFNELAEAIYHFLWDDFCDWYLEIAKARINAAQHQPKAVLAHCLDVLLRLLHPVAPFVTEAIWQKLNEVSPARGPGDEPAERLLATAEWPKADARAIHPAAEKDFILLTDLIRQIRNARTEHNVAPGKKVAVRVEAPADLTQTIARNVELMKSQAQLSEVTFSTEAAAPPADAAVVAAGGLKLYVLDIIDRPAEIARLTKQAETLRRGIASIEGKLSNAGFLAKAPAEVVECERQRLTSLQTDLSAVETALRSLQGCPPPGRDA